jgi:hypothetical protein
MDKEEEQVIPDPRPPERPTYNTVELSKKLTEVKGRAAENKRLRPVKDKKGKQLGSAYKATDTLYTEFLDEDTTLGNLSTEEVRIVRIHYNLANYTKHVGERLRINLAKLQNFYVIQSKSILVTSRAKGGFTAILTKTDKTISEQSIETLQKQQELEEKKARPWYNKLLGRG